MSVCDVILLCLVALLCSSESFSLNTRVQLDPRVKQKLVTAGLLKKYRSGSYFDKSEESSADILDIRERGRETFPAKVITEDYSGTALEYVKTYGYLDAVVKAKRSWHQAKPASDKIATHLFLIRVEDTIDALKLFQGLNNLPETGKLMRRCST